MRVPARSLPIALLALLLAACPAEEGSRRADPGTRPAEASPREADADADAGAVLTATGRPSFQGSSPFVCLPDAAGNLQIDFRTGSSALPVVAVRIEGYRGSGPSPARLFVTGRSLTGALVTSTGEAAVDLPGGTFRGQYDGEAGRGSIAGRFGSCNDSRASRGGSPPAAGPGMPETGGREGEGQPAGPLEEMP